MLPCCNFNLWASEPSFTPVDPGQNNSAPADNAELIAIKNKISALQDEVSKLKKGLV